MDFFLRIITLLILASWQLYWLITAKKAYKEKPRTSLKKNFVDYYISRSLSLVVFLQLFGLQIFPIPSDLNVQLIGMFIILLGIVISVSGRISLGTNWANAHEYQIKQNQALVTKGIYKYIRHPIYTGLFTVFTGAELVCESYLFIFVLVAGFIWSYSRGKREEILLEKHFGKQYLDYKKRTKMLIPFVW